MCRYITTSWECVIPTLLCSKTVTLIFLRLANVHRSFAAVTNCDIIWYDDDNRMYRIDDSGGETEISDENDLLGDFFGSASGNV